MNLGNFNLVLEQIVEHPDTWYQKLWHSVGRRGGGRVDAPKNSRGTAHCFAGWCQVMAGKKRDEHDDRVQLDACIFLGLPPVRTGKSGDLSTNIIWLFHADRTLSDFIAVGRGEIEPVSGMRMNPAKLLKL